MPARPHASDAPRQSQSGDTVSFSVTNTGSLLYDCHIPGHYDSGMVGDINVVATS